MDIVFDTKMETYYKKFIELQEKLRKSEEERLKLEMKFNEMLHVSREEEKMHYRKLRHQYRKFLDEDRRRQERNERLFRTLESVESRIDMLMSKTERLKMLRGQYHQYLKNATRPQPAPSVDHRQKPSPVQRASETTDRERLDYLEKYLKNLNSHSEIKMTENIPDYDKDLRKLDSLSSKLHSSFDSNRANDIAGDIMNSIYSRHYGKTEIKPNSKYSSPDINVERNRRSVEDLDSPDYRNIPQKIPESVVAKLPNGTETDRVVIQTRYPKESELEKSATKAPIGGLPVDTNVKSKVLFDENVPRLEHKMKIGNGCEDLRVAPDIDITESRKLYLESINDPLENMSPGAEKPTQIVKTYHDDEKIVIERAPLESEGNHKLDEIGTSLENTDQEVDHHINPNGDSKEIVELSLEQTHPAETTKESKETELPFVENTIQSSEEADQPPSQAVLNSAVIQNRPVSHDQQPVSEESCQNLESPTNPQYVDNPQPESTGQYAGDYSEHAEPTSHYEPIGQQLDQYDVIQQPLYDENGQPFVQYDENGQPIVQYDENGQDITQYDENGQAMLQYDENGQPVVQYDQNGQPIIQYDENGQPIVQYDENGQPIIQYDENGQPLYQYDEYGQPIHYYNPNDQTAIQYDETGQPVVQYDENGQPVPNQYDPNGQPVLQYDESGQPIVQYDENGQPITQYDEHGQIISQYDQNGQPIVQYDEGGQPITQYDGDIQYDEHGQPFTQYDQNGPPSTQYDQTEVQYDENFQPQNDQNGQSVVYNEDPSLQMGQYDGTSQPEEKDDQNRQLSENANATDEDTKQKILQEKEESSFGEEVKHSEESSESTANGSVVAQDKVAKNSMDIMDVLDTDTESTKHNTSKITNDSDFDFSNG